MTERDELIRNAFRKHFKNHLLEDAIKEIHSWGIDMLREVFYQTGGSVSRNPIKRELANTLETLIKYHWNFISEENKITPKTFRQEELISNNLSSPLKLRWDDVISQYKVDKPLDQSGLYVDKEIAIDMYRALKQVQIMLKEWEDSDQASFNKHCHIDAHISTDEAIVRAEGKSNKPQ